MYGGFMNSKIVCDRLVFLAQPYAPTDDWNVTLSEFRPVYRTAVAAGHMTPAISLIFDRASPSQIINYAVFWHTIIVSDQSALEWRWPQKCVGDKNMKSSGEALIIAPQTNGRIADNQRRLQNPKTRLNPPLRTYLISVETIDGQPNLGIRIDGNQLGYGKAAVNYGSDLLFRVVHWMFSTS
jgi:hypothetical protein